MPRIRIVIVRVVMKYYSNVLTGNSFKFENIRARGVQKGGADSESDSHNVRCSTVVEFRPRA